MVSAKTCTVMQHPIVVTNGKQHPFKTGTAQNTASPLNMLSQDNKKSNNIGFNNLLFHTVPISTDYNLLLTNHYQILKGFQGEFRILFECRVYKAIYYSFYLSLQY